MSRLIALFFCSVNDTTPVGEGNCSVLALPVLIRLVAKPLCQSVHMTRLLFSID